MLVKRKNAQFMKSINQLRIKVQKDSEMAHSESLKMGLFCLVL